MCECCEWWWGRFKSSVWFGYEKWMYWDMQSIWRCLRLGGEDSVNETSWEEPWASYQVPPWNTIIPSGPATSHEHRMKQPWPSGTRAINYPENRSNTRASPWNAMNMPNSWGYLGKEPGKGRVRATDRKLVLEIDWILQTGRNSFLHLTSHLGRSWKEMNL